MICPMWDLKDVMKPYASIRNTLNKIVSLGPSAVQLGFQLRTLLSLFFFLFFHLLLHSFRFFFGLEHFKK